MKILDNCPSCNSEDIKTEKRKIKARNIIILKTNAYCNECRYIFDKGYRRVN